MKKLIYILLGTAMIAACTIEAPTETTGIIFGGSDESQISNIPSEFNWENMKYQQMEIINTNTTAYNRKGELIADDLPLGTYLIATKCSDSLILVQETFVTIGSKAEENTTEDTHHIYFPSKGSYGTFMAEDLFPYKGDMDFNDIVFDYSFDYELVNSGKDVKSLTISINPRAVGGNAQEIGIGLKFYTPNVNIASVTGNSISEDGLFGAVNSDGSEAGQSSCTVVPLTDDFRSHFESREGFLNTFDDRSPIASEKINITVNFQEGSYPEYSSLVQNLNSELSGISLFIVIDSRGKEIFAKGNTPTDKFDTSLMETTGHDDFSDSNNFVWVIQNAESISYPVEMTSITEAYPQVQNWMDSFGTENQDWFMNPNASKIW